MSGNHRGALSRFFHLPSFHWPLPNLGGGRLGLPVYGCRPAASSSSLSVLEDNSGFLRFESPEVKVGQSCSTHSSDVRRTDGQPPSSDLFWVLL